jgi:hypothetical protein
MTLGQLIQLRPTDAYPCPRVCFSIPNGIPRHPHDAIEKLAEGREKGYFSQPMMVHDLYWSDAMASDRPIGLLLPEGASISTSAWETLSTNTNQYQLRQGVLFIDKSYDAMIAEFTAASIASRSR